MAFFHKHERADKAKLAIEKLEAWVESKEKEYARDFSGFVGKKVEVGMGSGGRTQDLDYDLGDLVS